MEQLTAMYPVCTFIKSDGNRCGSPALKGANFCFQHIGGSVSALSRARATTSGANARLKFVYPGTREAIQHNLSLVAQALSDGKIDTAMANTYNRLFRTCELNLRRWQMATQDPGVPGTGDQPGSPRTGLRPWGGQMLPLRDEAHEASDRDQEDGSEDAGTSATQLNTWDFHAND